MGWQQFDAGVLFRGDPRLQLALLGVAGLLYCFAGYRFFKVTVGLTGFLLGGGAALFLAGWLSVGHWAAMVVAGSLGGVCGAAVLLVLYRAGVFCIGLLGMLLVGYHMLGGRTEWWAPLAVLGLGAAGGILALVVERPAATLATSALGGWLLVQCGAEFLVGPELRARLSDPTTMRSTAWSLAGAWLAVSLLGYTVQLRTYQRRT